MNHSLRTLILSFTLLLCLPIEAVAATPDEAYAQGTEAMNDRRWADAVAAFDQVVNAKGKKADAAFYWKAYSLDKLGKSELAEATCGQLEAQYKSSPWNQDCAALRLTGNGSDRHGRSDYKIDPVISRGRKSEDPNADMKMLALNSLLNRDPAQAIPVLKNILTGDQPESVKKHALFVIEQSKSPEAHDVLRDLLLGKQGPELQREAIHGSAVFQGKRSNDALAELYKTTADAKIKKSIISAFFITQDTDRMVEIARTEKDLELKRTIVSQLALMPGKAANDYMMELLK